MPSGGTTVCVCVYVIIALSRACFYLNRTHTALLAGRTKPMELDVAKKALLIFDLL